MMRLAALFWLAVAGIVALFLFHVKYEVQHLEDRLEHAHKQINRDQEAIHILEAEWSHLNRPDRIGRLAEEHLGLQPAETRQLAGLQVLPARPLEAGPVEAAAEELETPAELPSAPKAAEESETEAAVAQVEAQVETQTVAEAPAPRPRSKPASSANRDLPAAVRTTLASMGSLR